MSGHDVIVIGASAGGVEAIREVTRQLPRDLAAAVFVVLHLPNDSRSILPEILSRAGPLPAVHPQDQQRIEHGVIHVAPSDHHMLLDVGVVRVVRGPRHNRHRPAIDPLFRSAARAYGGRVIGTVLTGALDDGTSGLEAIKRRGGLAVVQDPSTALFSGMPTSAIETVNVDHVVPLQQIGPLIASLTTQPAKNGTPPLDARLDEEFKKYMGHASEMTRMGKPSVFACPECHGVLWELDDHGVTQFHCRVGHSYSLEGLELDQNTSLETTLWAAVRALEESANLRRRIADRTRRHNRRLAESIERRAEASEKHATSLRDLLQRQTPSIAVREVENRE